MAERSFDWSDHGARSRLPIILIIVSIVWIVALCASWAWNLHRNRFNMVEHAVLQARMALEKDITYRRWNSLQGGVYAPVTETTQPNPHLDTSIVPDRDVMTTSGLRLTLINPAYMTRQVHEIEEASVGRIGHLTSLKPIRPENAPDPWEAAALRSFEIGATEAKLFNDNGRLRYMRPLVTELACLKCHGHQGYRVGDIRGGIGIEVPMAELESIRAADSLQVSFVHVLLLLGGLGGIAAGGSRIAQRDKARRQAEAAMGESENRFRTIFEMAPVGVTEIETMTGRYVRVNRRHAEILGYAVDEFHQLNFMAITHPEDLQADLDNMAALVAGKIRSFTMEKRYVRKDGAVVWASLTVSPMWQPGEKPSTHIGVIEDITERKKMEEDLKLTVGRLRTITEAAPVTILQCGTDGRVTYINRTIPGLTPEQVIGLPVHTFVPEEQRATIDQALETVFLKKETSEYESEGPSPDGSIRVYAVRVAPVLVGDKATSAVFIATDITTRRWLEQELRRVENERITLEERKKATVELIRLDREAATGRLAASVAHEINNPLSAIQARLSVLNRLHRDQAETSQHLDVISDQFGRIARTVRQLLDYTRRQALPDHDFSIAELIHNVAGLFAPVLNAAHISLHVACPDHLPQIRADADRIQEVLVNLFENARSILPAGAEIRIRAELIEPAPGRTFIEIIVEDDGPGLGDNPEAVFEAYVTSRIDGTGLGLYLARHICLAHGGTLTGENRDESRGARFRIRLPVSNREEVVENDR